MIWAEIATLVGCEVVRQKIAQVGHYLMRNDMYIFLNRPDPWKNEVKIKVENVITLIPDAFYKHNQMYHFLEVDHLQRMHKNASKIDKYRMLKESGVFQKQYGYFPMLTWVTTTEHRRKQLQGWCEGLSLQSKVYLWDEIK